MASGVAWITGPIQYNRIVDAERPITKLSWDFFGANNKGEPRRWRLSYKSDTRSFSVGLLNASLYDHENKKKLFDIYLPSAVSARDLPKGAIVKKLEAMLSPEDIAAALRLSITKQ